MARNIVDYKDSPYELEEHYGVGSSLDLIVTLRSLKENIGSCKADNERIIWAQEMLAKVHAVIL